MTCNTPLWPLLCLTGSWIGLITLAHVCLFSPECIIQSALAEKCPIYYLIGARRRGLRVSCVERKGIFDPVKLLSYKNQNLVEAQNLALNTSILVMYPHLEQGEWVSLLVHSQHKSDSVVGGEA